MIYVNCLDCMQIYLWWQILSVSCICTMCNNSLYLAEKDARIFVRGLYLFREANSFPKV